MQRIPPRFRHLAAATSSRNLQYKPFWGTLYVVVPRGEWRNLLLLKPSSAAGSVRALSQPGFPSQQTAKPGKSVPKFMHVPLPLIPLVHSAFSCQRRRRRRRRQLSFSAFNAQLRENEFEPPSSSPFKTSNGLFLPLFLPWDFISRNRPRLIPSGDFIVDVDCLRSDGRPAARYTI